MCFCPDKNDLAQLTAGNAKPSRLRAIPAQLDACLLNSQKTFFNTVRLKSGLIWSIIVRCKIRWQSFLIRLKKYCRRWFREWVRFCSPPEVVIAVRRLLSIKTVFKREKSGNRQINISISPR